MGGKGSSPKKLLSHPVLGPPGKGGKAHAHVRTHIEASVEAAIVNRKQSQFIVLFNVLSPLIPEQLCRGSKHS